MMSSAEQQRLAEDYHLQSLSVSSCSADVLRRVYDRNVILESLFTRGLSAYGTVRVTNLCFHKRVVVRFTTDQWKTNLSLNAHYTMHHADTNTDSFQFKLTVPIETLSSSPSAIVFAILYRAEYNKFWDNNNTRDYTIKILHRSDDVDANSRRMSKRPTVLTSESVQCQIARDYQAISIPSQQGKQPCGLRNLGGTCFMNSVLQALSFTSPLTDDLLLNKKILDTNNTANRIVANEFVNLLYLLHCNQYSSISPAPFKQILGDLQPMYRANEQQDAHEFLTYLLDYLHDALDKRDTTKLTREHHSASLVPLHSPIVDLFYGTYQSSTTCLKCSKRALIPEPFMCLTLPIPSIDHCTLDDCLKQLTADEYLSDDSQWFCPSCAALCNAKRNLIIQQLPPVLIIQLKRFEMSVEWGWIKNQAVVLYPEDNLEFECSSKSRYTLYCVVNHQGSLDDGHYTTFCRDLKDERSPWWFCDDERIQYLDEEHFHCNSNAYLLFYALATTITESAVV